MTALAQASHAWRLEDLLAGLVDPSALGARARESQVSSLALDTRTLIPGSLFLACRGRKAHGLAFAEEAKRRGATAILGEIDETWSRQDILDLGGRLALPVVPVECLDDRLSLVADRFYGSPSARLDMLGVSGGSGKSSVGHLLAQALDAERSCAVLGGLGVGFPGDLHVWPEMALDPLTLQWTLSQLHGQGARSVSLEIQPHLSGLRSVAGVCLGHLVFTPLGDETGGAPSRIAGMIAPLRSLLVRAGLERVVLSLDDPISRALRAEAPTSVAVSVYSLLPDAALPDGCESLIRARSIEIRPRGLRLHVERLDRHGSEQAALDVALIGRFNAANLLAVLAVLCARGDSLERAARLLSRVRGVPGRMEAFGDARSPLVVVDAARTPQALERALRGLRSHAPGRLIGVLGCAGEGDAAERPMIGALAERLCDTLILADANPRGEPGDAIIADILAGVTRPERIRVERQRGLAIRRAIALAGIGDAVLIAGKGHETTQDMGDLKVHFSDRAQVVEALREWREGHH